MGGHPQKYLNETSLDQNLTIGLRRPHQVEKEGAYGGCNCIGETHRRNQKWACE